MRGEDWEILRFGILLILMIMIFTIFGRVDLQLVIIVGLVLIYVCKILTNYQKKKR
jgi:hypothetical protein